MQMTKHGGVKSVPDDLVEFMAARGWEPLRDLSDPPLAEDEFLDQTFADPVGDHELVSDPTFGDDVDDHQDVDEHDHTDPAEEQS